MATKIKRNYIVLDTIGLWALMAYMLTPITSDIPWLQNLLLGLCLGLFLTYAVLLIIWSVKKQLPDTLRFSLRDARRILMLNMVIFAGVVTHFAAGKERGACVYLACLIISVLATSIPVKRRKSNSDQE